MFTSFSKWFIIVVVQQLLLFAMSTGGIEQTLTQSQLRDKYGQENTTFNDGQSCYRQCDGKPKTCYYEFNVQMYDSMSGLCNDCENGVISDCFRMGCVTANGVARSLMTINHKLPGPSIDVCKDDRIIVDVMNHMSGQELSFHWHGLHQKESPWMDGVPMVTQCPIFEGNSFRYVFNAREAGTHYYHAHSGLHRSNGLFGKLNVRDTDDPNADYYDYDMKEHSILLSDWNNVMAEEKIPGPLLPSHRDPAFPDSFLINGFGNYFDKKLDQYTYAPIAAFYVERGKRHRIRIDNTASLVCPLEFSIKEHNLTIIATDGFSIEPIVVDSVVTSAGERFDMVLNAMNDPNINETIVTVRGVDVCLSEEMQEFARVIFVDDIKNYTKRIEDHEPLNHRPPFESLNIPKKSINSPEFNCTDPNSLCIVSLKQKEVPSSVGGNLRNETAEKIEFQFKNFLLNDLPRPSNYRNGRMSTNSDVINNIANIGSSTPVLTQDDSTIQYCNKDNLPDNCDNKTACYCHHLVQLELCKVYEFLLIDGRDQYAVSHPIHLHGFSFQVIDMGTKEELQSGQSAFANATHLPVVKDTVIIPSRGFTKIRFRACNPGYWFFHCHIEEHMHSGMTAIIKVGNRSDMLPPPQNFPTCDLDLVISLNYVNIVKFIIYYFLKI